MWSHQGGVWVAPNTFWNRKKKKEIVFLSCCMLLSLHWSPLCHRMDFYNFVVNLDRLTPHYSVDLHIQTTAPAVKLCQKVPHNFYQCFLLSSTFDLVKHLTLVVFLHSLRKSCFTFAFKFEFFSDKLLCAHRERISFPSVVLVVFSLWKLERILLCLLRAEAEESILYIAIFMWKCLFPWIWQDH